MLNSLEEATQAQLAGVLQRAEQNTGFRLDPQAEAQAQEWHISILSGDEVRLGCHCRCMASCTDNSYTHTPLAWKHAGLARTAVGGAFQACCCANPWRPLF